MKRSSPGLFIWIVFFFKEDFFCMADMIATFQTITFFKALEEKIVWDMMEIFKANIFPGLIFYINDWITKGDFVFLKTIFFYFQDRPPHAFIHAFGMKSLSCFSLAITLQVVFRSIQQWLFFSKTLQQSVGMKSHSVWIYETNVLVHRGKK